MTVRFEPTTFTAGQGTAISGMPEAQQRNLRRHDYLRKAETGWARLTAVSGLCEMLVYQQLSERGVPPATSKPIAAKAAPVIAFWAQQLPGAVADPKNLARGEMPIQASSGFSTRFLVWNGQKPAFTDDLSQIYNDTSYQSGELAAAIVLDLKSLAAVLVQRAGSPLWHVLGEED